MFTYPQATYEADPFPHVVVKDAWSAYTLLDCKAEVSIFDDWSGEKDFHGARKKRFCSEPDKLPPTVSRVIEEANSPRFLRWLEEVTGERDLVADPYLLGGGIHSILPGGFLGVHTDFNYIEGRKLYRRLNVLIYLNPYWLEEWGGALELWKDGHCAKSVPPRFNTMVVFTTDDESHHGHPHPLACPEGVTRDSIALYYYSKTKPEKNFNSTRLVTDYKAIRLNLGCGHIHMPGFINVDMPSNYASKKPDLEHDLTQPLPFADGTVAEINAIHIFEHFYRYESDQVLMDWCRVLKPGGKMVLELPCLEKILDIFRYCSEKGVVLPENLTLWGLFGDPHHCDPGMCHRWCYSSSELTKMMELNGLTVFQETPLTHQPVRDMRLVGIKSRES
jgi:hypothetical protein